MSFELVESHVGSVSVHGVPYHLARARRSHRQESPTAWETWVHLPWVHSGPPRETASLLHHLWSKASGSRRLSASPVVPTPRRGSGRNRVRYPGHPVTLRPRNKFLVITEARSVIWFLAGRQRRGNDTSTVNEQNHSVGRRKGMGGKRE